MGAITNRLANLRRFLAEVVRSRLARLMVFLHAAWFFITIANMLPPDPAFAKFLEHFSGSTTTLFAGRPFHFAYESPAMQFLFLADMPSLIAGIPVGFLISPLMRLAGLDFYSGSYVGAFLMLLVASCQWLTIGKLLESRLSSSNWGKRFLGFVHHYFFLVAGSIFLFTAIAAPIVNAHSRQRASRHSASSHR